MAPLHLENFIGGEYVQARTDRRTDWSTRRPARSSGDAPTSGQADVDLAYESAAKAFESWRSTTPAQRQEALLRGRRTGARGREWFHVRAGDRSRPPLARSSM
jgi:betaine-aldehyde dehydrogenase